VIQVCPRHQSLALVIDKNLSNQLTPHFYQLLAETLLSSSGRHATLSTLLFHVYAICNLILYTIARKLLSHSVDVVAYALPMLVVN